jgi:hypothetical protein
MRGWRRDDAPIAPDVVPSVIAVEECSSRGRYNPTSTQTCWPKRAQTSARCSSSRRSFSNTRPGMTLILPTAKRTPLARSAHADERASLR